MSLPLVTAAVLAVAAGGDMLRRGSFNKREREIRRLRAMTDDELIGQDIEVLDFAAFGLEPGIQQVPLERLRIQYPSDLENAKHQVSREPRRWVKHLDKPIEVSIKGGRWVIEDGHHRYVTSKRLGRATILAQVTAKDNPIRVLRAMRQGSLVRHQRGTPNVVKRRTLDALDRYAPTEPVTTRTAARLAGLAKGQTRKALKALQRQGKVHRDHEGHWVRLRGSHNVAFRTRRLTGKRYDPSQVVLGLYAGRKRIGYINALPRTGWGDAKADAAALGSKRTPGYMVANVWVDPAYRNQGLGLRLYNDLFTYLVELEGGPVIVGPMEATLGSGTSSDAQRAWRSLRRGRPSSGLLLLIT